MSLEKVAIIGAGSADFTWKLADQLFANSTLSRAEVALCDIDPRRLKAATHLVQKIADKHHASPTITPTTERRDAIKGSTVVINTIRVGGYQATEIDFKIPEKYHIQQTVADTAGIGGIMLAARTLPVVKGILRDMEELNPEALFLNHTNPLATMVLGAHHFSPEIKTYGLCHSVDETAQDLAEYLHKPLEELEYQAGGINHLAFFTSLTQDGRDLYPDLFKALQNPKIWEKDAIRFEIMKFFKFFPSESSTHWADYVPFFLHHNRPELIKQLNIEPNYYLTRLQELNTRWEKQEQNPELQIQERQTREYDPLILDSILTGNSHKIVLTVPNDHEYIKNLPKDSAVEVSCLTDSRGIHPKHFGNLPTQLVGLIQPHITIQQLVVEAIEKKDPDYLVYAAALDPRVSAVLTLDQTAKMVQELAQAHSQYLPWKQK